MQLTKSRALYLSAFLTGSILTGCNRAPSPDLTAEVSRLNAELDATRQKLAATEKELKAEKDATGAAAGIADAAKKQLGEKSQVAAQLESQVRALQTEIGEQKRNDAARFAEASATMQKGVASISLDHYQSFVRDFPNSPMVADAKRAIAELSTTADKDAKWRTNLIDPKKQEREALERFNDGTVTLTEIAPLLRNRSAADVIKMLGRPNNTFRNGLEIGYADKVLDANTGSKGTLIIKFENDAVSTLRIGYQGREVRP